MNADADADQRASTWRVAVKTLLAASPGLERPADRRRAELLAGLLLLLIVLGLLSGLVQLAAVPNFFPTFLAMLGGITGLTAAYALSRTRRYRLAALLTCLAPLGACLSILGRNPQDPVALPFMVLGVLFAAVFLPTSAACLTALGLLALDGLMAGLLPAIGSPERWIPTMAFHATVSALLVVAARQRNRIESDQDSARRRLEAHNRQLEQERERLERQLASATSLATVGRLVTGLGHDLNNLLMLMLDLHGQVDTEDRGLALLLERADGAGEAATRIVRDMLALARSAEPAAPHPLIDLNDVVTQSQALLGCAAGRRCRLDVRCHPEPLPSRVSGLDVLRVLLNLASNAGQAMTDGGVLTIRTHPAEEVPAPRSGRLERPHAAIVVEDSGVGMDAAALARAFEPFVSSRATEGGFGMGLAIVADLVGRHGGSVDASSEPGRGTRFTIFLPLA